MIYMSVKANEKRGYCSVSLGQDVEHFFPDSISNKPLPDFVPPIDKARDLLLVGFKRKGEIFFKKVKMKAFRGRGCGSLTRKFGGNPQSLIVARGRAIHNGYNYLLEWGPPPKRPPTNPPEETPSPTPMLSVMPSPTTTMAPTNFSLASAEPTTLAPMNTTSTSIVTSTKDVSYNEAKAAATRKDTSSYLVC